MGRTHLYVLFFALIGAAACYRKHPSAPLTVNTNDRLPGAPFFGDEEFETKRGDESQLSPSRSSADDSYFDLGAGAFTSTISSSDDVVRALVLSSDGQRVFLAGRVATASSSDNMLIAKLDFIGNWDTSFSSDGWASLDFGSNQAEMAHAVAWQTDGKVVLGGRASNGTNFDFALARFLTDGSLDTGFDTDGKKTHTVGSGLDIIRGLAFQTDGMVVAGGYTLNASHFDFVGSRYLTNGALDTTFGTSGVVQLDLAASKDDVATALAVTTDGKTILAGASYNGSNNWDIALARLRTEGSLDTTFDSDGKIITTIGGGDDILWSVTLDSNSHILGAGETNNGSNQDFLVVKYFTQGTLDTNFSSDGVFLSTLSGANDVARGIALTTDGKIVIAGVTNNATIDMALMRILTNGTTDSTFGSGGATTETPRTAEDSAFGVAVAPDGKVYSAGRTNNGSNFDLALVRTANNGMRAFWVQQAFLKASNADSGDGFGSPISISNDTLVVGAIGEDSSESTVTNGSTASTDNALLNSGAAYVFVRTGTVWTQQAYLKPANMDSVDAFSTTVAVSKDTVAIGSRLEDSNQTTITNGSDASTDNSLDGSGAAYVFTRAGTVWTQQAYIKAANADSADNFSLSLALFQDTLVVGSQAEDSSQNTITNGTAASTLNDFLAAGAAYVYVRSGSVWSQQAYLKPPNPDSSDAFGAGISISNDTIVVGASGEDSDQVTITNGSEASTNNSRLGAGAVYVFVRSGTVWTQQAYLKAPNADSNDGLAGAQGVSISNDTIVVAASGEDSDQVTITNGSDASTSNALPGSGAVYVFVRDGTTWSNQAYLKAPNADSSDGFGLRVTITNDTIVATTVSERSNQQTISNGTYASTNNDYASCGAAYVFARSGTVWTQQAYLKAPNADSGDQFGNALSASNDTVIVGSGSEDSNQNTITNGSSASTDNSLVGSGAVYVFTR